MLEPPIGSDFYYALRFSKAPIEPLKCLWAFFQTIKGIQPPHIDESIAPVKLQWWQAEIQRTYLEIPEHPITCALLPFIHQYNLSQNDFQQTIAAHIALLQQPHFSDWEQLRLLGEQKIGAQMNLYAQLLGSPAVIPAAFSLPLGTALFLIEIINHFGQDLQNGKLLFPQSDLDFFGITPTQLFNKQCPQGDLASLLLRQANRARQHYHSALAALPMVDRFAQLPLLILANCQLALLAEIESEHFAVLHHTYRLTPLRQCWIAWRSYRTELHRRNHGNRRIKR